MGSRGHEYLNLGLHSYPCARLRNWSHQTFWRYPPGTALLFRQYPLGTVLILSPRGTTAELKGTLDRSCTRYRSHAARPPRALVRARSRAVIPRAEYESKVTIDVMKLNATSQSQWSGGALTGTRSYGASEDSTRLSLRPKDRTHASIIFLGSKLGLYQQSLTACSILEHESICSPPQFAHRHEKPYRLFFSNGNLMETH